MTDNVNRSEALKYVGVEELQLLAEQAFTSTRKRSHLLMHAGPDDLVQRLIIAAQPGTYVRPHQHSQQWEMLVLQSGSVDVVTFDATGKILERKALNEASPVVQIPVSVWHSCVVRETSVLIEIKPGSYRPNEFADWAPEERHAQVTEFLRWATLAKPQEGWERG